MAIPCSEKDRNLQSYAENCDGDVARRVYDPCVERAIQNLDPSSGGSPKTKTIFNEIIAVADTEQSIVLPTSICGYFIRTRGKGTLKISHNSGESGTLYQEIPSNASFTDNNAYSNLTLYFQSPNVGEVVEVVTWT